VNKSVEAKPKNVAVADAGGPRQLPILLRSSRGTCHRYGDLKSEKRSARAQALPGGGGIGTSVARAAGAQSWGQ
jgi:hypothetical protein